MNSLALLARHADSIALLLVMIVFAITIGETYHG